MNEKKHATDVDAAAKAINRPPTPGTPAPSHPRFQRRRALTLPLLSINHTPHLFVEILDKVELKSMPDFAQGEDGTVPVVKVKNLETGEDAILIVTAIMLTRFEELGEYVGLKLEIEAGERREGKKYRDLRMWELS